jgi:hypothetical protein
MRKQHHIWRKTRDRVALWLTALLAIMLFAVVSGFLIFHPILLGWLTLLTLLGLPFSWHYALQTKKIMAAYFAYGIYVALLATIARPALHIPGSGSLLGIQVGLAAGGVVFVIVSLVSLYQRREQNYSIPPSPVAGEHW